MSAITARQLTRKANMKPHFFTLIALLLTTLPAAAQPQDLPRARIEKILGAYASSLGCEFEMDRKNIVKADIKGDGDTVYVALYIIDNDCSGGSGSWNSNLAVLDLHEDYPDKGGIYVRPKMTMPEIYGIGLPRFIDRIFIKDGQLWFAGRIHADNDGNNFPTIPVQARIQLLHSAVQLDPKHKTTIYYWKSAEDFEGK